VATSSTLTAGVWNFIPLEAPVQLAPGLDLTHSAYGSTYVAAVGVNGNFPETVSQWGPSEPYAAGITSGNLVAYSGPGGSLPPPYGLLQGTFNLTESDPAAGAFPPLDGDSDSNFWVDVQLSAQAPAGYEGTYRLWPNKVDSNAATDADSAVAYSVATEIDVASSVTTAYIHYFVPNGASATAGLATRADIWDIATGTAVATLTTPAWVTETGGTVTIGTYGQWVKAPLAVTLLPGQYRVSVYNANGALGGWNAKDSATGYFTTGVAENVLTSGPLSAPNLSGAQLGTYYTGTGSGPTNAQPVFAYSGSDIFPVYTTGNNPPQCYWVDLEAYPATQVSDTAETCQGTDSVTSLTVTFSDSDACHGADIVTSAFDADGVTGADAVTALAVTLADTDSGHATDAGEDAAGSPVPRSTEYAHGEDSGFNLLQDREDDEGPAAETAVVTVLSAEACSGSDRSGTAWPADGDSVAGAEIAYWSGPVSSAEACHGTDACAPPPPQAEACAVSDAAVPSVGVYTFQPPFRWTGGGYELVLGVPALDDSELLRDLLLWRGARPDGTAFRLAAAHAEGRLRFVSSCDSSRSVSYEDLFSLPVTLLVAPALDVRLELSP
jgi:hypothetical protein